MSNPMVLPPSPPSTSSRRKPVLPKPLADATSTPESASSFPGSSTAGGRKRVEFSTGTNPHEPASSLQRASSLPQVRSLPPSSECQISLKSILKPVAAEDQPLLSVHHQQDRDCSMHEMMESIVNQLSQDDRKISLDAYRTLTSVVREYDEIPEEAVLRSKINTILKYIKRDLSRQSKPDESPIADTNLVTQALKVLVIFVWSREYASLLSDEYRAFILDRSIQVIDEHTASKSVIMHYLHLLATQDFRPGLITSNNRVARLLEALQVLPEHVKGNGVVSERLLVYQRLLAQAKQLMKARANLWVEELLTGMTSTLKDIRVKAMALGMKACSEFRSSTSISATVRSILEKELAPSKKFSSCMCRKLEKMISAREEASQVPQIWAIVIVLSNGPDTQINTWSEFKDWLTVIQRCFNSSESAVRQQANMAWNRFVYLVRPHEASGSLMAMLAKPLAAQLERQGTDKTVKSSRATAASSYCNLLYYAFRSKATHKEYTRVWNEYIVKVMKSSLFEKNAANSDLACRILIALLWNPNTNRKLYNDARGFESTPVDPDELPTIDCKWVRARALGVIEIFSVLLRYSSWGASGQSDRAYIAVAWTHFLKALREASSKEIKPSSEARHATTSVLDFLGRLWIESSKQKDDASGQTRCPSIAQIRQMTRSAVIELGADPVLASLGEESAEIENTFILGECLKSVLAALKKLTQDEQLRSQLHYPKITLGTFLSHYEKGLELLNACIMGELQSDGLNLTALAEALTTIEQVLSGVSEQQLVQTFSTISGALVPLLKDEGRQFGDSPDEDFTRAYQKFVKTVMHALTKVPSSAVSMLDEIFAAPFESSHASGRAVGAELWDTYFANQQSLVAGPRLLDALDKLGNAMDAEVSEAQQSPEDHDDGHGPVSDPANAGGPSPHDHAHGGPEKMQPAGEESPILGSQHQELDMAPTSRPRSRHDDSQLHFVAIESSPVAHEEPESQFLTAHQKEVRDRQRSEPAVVFPDLRSTPREHGRSESQGTCGFARKAAALAERPSTPTLPRNHDQEEPEIAASPTPRARHFAKQITDIDVPSSPPSMPDNQEKEAGEGDVLSSPLQAPVEDAHIGIDFAIPQHERTMDEGAVHTAETSNGADVDEGLATEEPVTVHEELPPVAADPTVNDKETIGRAAAQQAIEVEVYLPSTVEETPMDVDANKPEGESTPRADRDEIDILSASQLSQDLDRHISQAAEDTHEMEELHQAQVEEPESQSQRSRGSRKRKAPRSAPTVAKRTRRSKTSSQQSSESSEPPVAPLRAADVDEMMDFIEVAPSQATKDTALSVQTQPALKSAEPSPSQRTRRTRRRARHSQAADSQNQQVEVVVPITASQTPEDPEVTAADVVVVEDTNEVAQDQPVAEDVSPEPQAQENGEDYAPKEAGIVFSLQDVLMRLTSGNAGEIDLRAVDDLCYQIRFQAQEVLAQRNEA
ncbi:RAP1-interacting factor 1 [Exophiala viscosa]|uniref:RAP1-interacting factor 1 n=1 Tax=Exophiala viscosa TaxID=2486360 RepID=A0AAN6DYK0_9EURO|nr:RAP1-interacting factor 1 [Exophiala viscosa]